jgi:hypothetical protein
MRAIVALLLIATLSASALAQEAAIKQSTYTHKVIKPPVSTGAGYDVDFSDVTVGGIPFGASTDLHFLTSQAEAGLSNEVNLGALSTGLMKLTISGSIATPSTIADNSSNWDTAYTERRQWDGGSTNLVAATGRGSLGLVIGTNVEAWDSDLDSIAALATTAFGRGSLTQADATAFRTYIGAGTASGNTTNWDTAFTERRQWDGGSTNLVAATGRTSLGLVPGTNVEAYLGNPSTDGSILSSTAAGVRSWITPAGGGNVSNSGTPTSGQLAQWVNSTAIQGVTSISTSQGGLPSGGSAGQMLIKNSSTNYDTTWQSLNYTGFGAGNNTTTSTAGVMFGYGQQLTPRKSGNVLLIFQCYLTGDTVNMWAASQFRYGTGTPPGANSALTGTPAGNNVLVQFSAVGARQNGSTSFILTGLTLGTQYWFDVTKQVSTGTGTWATPIFQIVEL